jgi:hypothetical protein
MEEGNLDLIGQGRHMEIEERTREGIEYELFFSRRR